MKNRALPVITLTTDFGITDEYAAVVKGVILSRTTGESPAIIDLTHSIPPYDVNKAAFLINSAYRYFPKGSIHLVIVDPGVGGDRDIILVQEAGHLFLAPDNGVLSLIIRNSSQLKANLVKNSALFLPSPCSTFHGRDIFAPVAAHLALGTAPTTVGPLVSPDQLTLLSLPAPVVNQLKGEITGTIVSIDHFGNIMTNIDRKCLQQLSSCLAEDSFTLIVEEKTILPLRMSYQDASPGTALTLFNSRDYIEIAVNQGNAARTLDLEPGDLVRLKKM